MQDKNKYPTKITLIIRALISAYILYLAWGLRTAPAESSGLESILFIVVIIVFVAFAVLYGGRSLLALKKGEYCDADEDDKAEEE